MRKSKERKVSSNIWKEVWSVVQWRNVKPPRVVNLWSFETKEEAESFMKKNDFVVFEKQNSDAFFDPNGEAEKVIFLQIRGRNLAFL